MTQKLPLNTVLQYCKKKQFNIKSPLICLFLLFTTYSFGQRNVCDNNANGEIAVGTSCNFTTMNTNTSNDYWDGVAGCNGGDFDDKWAWFIATATSTTITYQPDFNFFFPRDPIMHLFTGNCSPTMPSFTCVDDNAGNGTETITIATTIGTRYRIRIQDYDTDNQMNGDICVYSAPPPPANDICTTATSLTPSSDATCNNITGGTLGANTESELGECSIAGISYDVWYSFMATATNHDVIVDGIAGFDAVITAVSTCNTTNSPTGGDTCVDDTGNDGIETMNLSGLTIGNTYYVQVQDFNNDLTDNAFTICVTTPTPPVDPCDSAIALPCSTTNLAGTTIGSTAFVSNSGCSISEYGVWYTFVGDGVETTITSTADFDHEMAITSGSCGAFTNLDCVDDVTANNTETFTFTPTNGINYYIYIAHFSSISSTTGNFTISRTCVSPCTTPTNQPTALTFATVTDLSISGNFTASVPTSSNYLVLMNTTGTAPTAPTDGISYAIGNTTLGATVIDNDTDTAFIANGLTPSTQYFFFVYSINDQGCSGGPLYNTVNPLTGDETTLMASYCIPASTSSSNYIDDFSTTNGLTNITNNNTGYTAGGYADYTSMIASQAPGGNITFSADFIYGFGGMGVGIWVDWNNDLDFNDANEQIFDSAGYVANLNFNYTIPGVPAGTYRVRILADYWETSPDPCVFDSTGPAGEAEDYSLTITALNCTDDPISLTAAATSTTTGTISWTAPAPAPANGYEYIVSTDNSTITPAGDITGTTTGTTVNLTGLTAGTTYYVFVRGICNAVDFGIWVNTTFSTSCSNIINTPTVCPLIAGEQGVDPFTVDPFDPDPSFNLDCTSPTLTLQAHSTIRETDSYIVEQIAYPSPAPDYDFPTFGGVGVQTITDDDVWADARTTLGINFCYYGNTYTETLVGANGMISFDSSITPGSSCGYEFNNNLPSLADDLFNQTIYGVYHDIDPRGLTGTPIKSRLVGTTPGCRQFMVSWHDIPMFSDATRLYTGMIVLHETTNIIEVFIEEKRIENGNVGPWNDGNAIVGLQGDANAGEAITAPCRNGLDTNWETTNEAWRFVPSGAIIAPDSIEWFSASTGSTVLGTSATLAITTPNTYTAEVTYTTCGITVTYSDDVVVDQSSKTWNGSINTNWYVHDNWTPSGVPTLSDCVLIPDTALSNGLSPIADDSNIPGTAPIPPALASALNLTVDTNGYIEVLAGTNLQVVDWINLSGTIDIRNTGSLIQVNDGAPNVNNNSGNGSINMQRTATIASSYDYIYWSSPVEGFGVSNVSPGSTLIYEWIPTIAGNGAGNYGNWQATTENMINGKGYIIRDVAGTPTASTPEFVGRPNNGVITKAITRGNYNLGDYTGGGSTIATRLDDNWNLVGNPYPSAISADAFITVNAGIIDDDINPSIAGTVYLWRHLATPSNVTNDPFYEDFVYNYNPNDYIAYNSSGSNPSGFGGDIAAGQSFFVLMENAAPAASSNIVFNNTMRNETLNNSQFYRENKAGNRSSNNEKHRIWLDLITPNNTANSILVGYIEGASNNFDRLFDGHELSETSTRFYSIIDTEEFGIQGKELPFDANDTVALGVEIPQDGNYSIAINTLDGLFQDTDQAIYIEDTYTGTIHNLRINPYSFNIEAGTYDDRFVLKYNETSLSIDDYEVSGLEIIAPNNSYIKVKSGNSIIKTVIVYDLLGRALINKTEINTSEISFKNNNLSEGAYIVKAILTSGKQKIQKVVLKH